MEFCGFPSYKLTDYVRALLTEGFSIAKYEQYEQEQANGERVLLRRVDRIYTPGTLVEEELVRSAADSQFLMALDVVDDRQESREANLDPSKRHSAVRPSTTVAFACVDLSSGAFHMDECAAEDLPHKLAFIQPKEILVSAAYNHVFGDPMKMLAGGVKAEQSTDTLTTATPAPTPATTGTTTTIEPDTAFNADQAVRFLASMFAVHDPSDAIVRRRVLEHIVHKDVPQSSLGAASSLLQYVVRAQSGVLPLLDRPTRFDKDVMAIDVETQRSLELMRNMRRGDRHGTLFQYLDATVTPLGARALAARIVAPSASLPVINARHDMVQIFAGDLTLTADLRKAFARHLRHDPARAIQNLKFNYGGPWHLGIVLETLWGLKRVQEVLGRREATARLGEGLAVPGRLSQLLESVLADGGDVSDDCSSSLERLAGLPRVLDRPGILRPECNRDLLHAKDEYEAVVSKSADLLEELRSICKLESLCTCAV